MNKYLLPLLAASTAAMPALAAPTITFNQTSTGVTGSTAGVFENFETPANAATAGTPFVSATQTATAGGTSITTVTETGSGATTRVFPGTVPGTAVSPLSTGNQFLAVEAGGTFTVTFAAPVQFFSFVIGSIDTYNNLKLVLSDGTTVGGVNGLSGAAIVNTPISFNANGNSSTAGRVSYDFGGGAGLKSAIFTSTQDAFEIDDLAAAVPEAATWAMMMVGLGVVGGAMRRRQTKVAVRFAAA